MGTLPYFKYYPGDWLSDPKVRMLSPESRGIYWDLLSVAWQEGSIPDPPAKLAGWLNCPPHKFKKVWAEIEGFWVHGSEGTLVNPRQELERMKAAEAHQRRVEAGRKGGLASEQSRSNA